MSKTAENQDLPIIIVGGGPAGLGAALAFSNKNYNNIIVLEGREDMIFDQENSYAVGLNVRGQNSIKELFKNSINKQPEVADMGLRVDQWKIIVGPGINVANFDSGLVVGTTRAEVTNLLFEETKTKSNIKVLFGHKAKTVDLKMKKLIVDTPNGEKDFFPRVLIIADGYKSKVRDALAQMDNSFKIEQWQWNSKFRVLLSEPNPKTDLNAYIHYIQNGTYISKFNNGRWSAVLSIRNNSPDFLSSFDPSDENVDELMKHVKKIASPAFSLFSKEEYRKYFSRSIFSGSVTKVSKLLIDEWALLIGDAAHSTIPATGEGINSALEDCSILQQILNAEKSLSENLIEFEKKRLLDVNALSDIAYGAARPSFKSAFQTIIIKLGQVLRLAGPTKEDYLFGKNSAVTKTYSEVLKIWKKQTAFLFGPTIPKN